MAKKILIIAATILIAFALSFSYWYFSVQKQKSAIEKAVLTSLEEGLEFCEIIKSEIVKENGKFWLICNNRPFYAEYVSGELKYELNGWSFLKENLTIWNDLENCDFYDSEKVDNNYNLTFYCPRDFQAEELKAKTYLFNTKTLKMNKLGEKDTLNVITDDIKSIYPFLSECEIKSFSLESYETPVLFLNYSCEDGEWFALSQALLSLQPPILMNQDLSYEERARISFEKSFDCEVKSISSIGPKLITIDSTCQDREFSMIYEFSDIPFVSFRVKCKEPCLEFGKYFIFPPLKDIKKATLIKKLENVHPGTYYKVGDEIILLEVQKDYITEFWKPWGKIYE